LQQLAFNQEVSLMEFFTDSAFIAKLIGYCDEPLSLVMKYYPLGSLDRWFQANHIKINDKLKILQDVSRGLKVMHERKVAHCDMKPQNILVDNHAGKVSFVVTDFGVSKILTDEYLASRAFQIRNIRGLTVSYAAPDVLHRFRIKNVITSPYEEMAGDIYSFACLIFFILTGLSPWEL
jgi:serine/threonine protein kinase